MVRVPEAKSDCSRQGEAEVRILDFKTTWSNFQMSSQTATTEAKLRYMFRVSSPPQSWSKAVVCVSTPRMYPRSGYFLVSQNLMKVLLLIRVCWKENFSKINKCAARILVTPE